MQRVIEWFLLICKARVVFNGSSKFLEFRGRNIRIVLLYLLLCPLMKIHFAVMVFRQAVTFAIRTLTAIALESQEPYFFMTAVALRVIELLNRCQLEILELILSFFNFEMLSILDEKILIAHRTQELSLLRREELTTFFAESFGHYINMRIQQ